MLVTLPPPLSGCVPARARPAAPSSSSVVLSQKHAQALALRPVREPASDEAVHELVELPRRHAPEHRARDRRARPEGAAEVDVVRLAALPVLVARGRPLEADVADPVLRARVGASVEVQPQLRDVLAEPVFEPSDQRIEPRLGLGHRVVAVRLPGAGDPVAAKTAELEGQVQPGERRHDGVDVGGGDVREQEVLLPRDPRLRAERLEQVGERDEARAAEQPEVDGHADARQPVGLGADAEVTVRFDVDRGERKRRAARTRAAARPPLGRPRGRARRP